MSIEVLFLYPVDDPGVILTRYHQEKNKSSRILSGESAPIHFPEEANHHQRRRTSVNQTTINWSLLKPIHDARNKSTGNGGHGIPVHSMPTGNQNKQGAASQRPARPHPPAGPHPV